MSGTDIKLKDEEQEVLGTFKVSEENVSWDELENHYKEIARDIIDLQMLIAGMAKENEVVINSNPKIYGIVSGLLKTISDVSTEIVNIRSTFAPTNALRSGTIDKDDEDNVIIYLTASSNFISAAEKLANLSAVAITDIISMLKLDPTLLKQAEDLKDEISNKEK